MDDDDRVRQIPSNDLQFDPAFVWCSPDQASIESRARRDLFRLGRLHHVQNVGLADPVASCGTKPSNDSIRLIIVAHYLVIVYESSSYAHPVVRCQGGTS